MGCHASKENAPMSVPVQEEAPGPMLLATPFVEEPKLAVETVEPEEAEQTRKRIATDTSEGRQYLESMHLSTLLSMSPMSHYPAAVGPPTAAACPPGQCVIPESWVALQLLERSAVSHDAILVTFGLANDSKSLGLSTCACILAKFDEVGNPEPIVRPYTPISTNKLVGKLQLLIKVYEGGKMSEHIEKMPIGSSLEFKHVPFNVKIQYPFGKKHITMLVGGTGITPMLQALHCILGTSDDSTQVTMLIGNKTQADILCKELLDKWAFDFPSRLKVVYVLSRAAQDRSWNGLKGHITGDLIKEHCAPPSEDTIVFVCGPPPMYEALCGPREKGGKPTEDIYNGALKALGYTPEQVFKF